MGIIPKPAWMCSFVLCTSISLFHPLFPWSGTWYRTAFGHKAQELHKAAIQRLWHILWSLVPPSRHERRTCCPPSLPVRSSVHLTHVKLHTEKKKNNKIFHIAGSTFVCSFINVTKTGFLIYAPIRGFLWAPEFTKIYGFVNAEVSFCFLKHPTTTFIYIMPVMTKR